MAGASVKAIVLLRMQDTDMYLCACRILLGKIRLKQFDFAAGPIILSTHGAMHTNHRRVSLQLALNNASEYKPSKLLIHKKDRTTLKKWNTHCTKN